jgi:hypothetical protein
MAGRGAGEEVVMVVVVMEEVVVGLAVAGVEGEQVREVVAWVVGAEV